MNNESPFSQEFVGSLYTSFITGEVSPFFRFACSMIAGIDESQDPLITKATIHNFTQFRTPISDLTIAVWATLCHEDETVAQAHQTIAGSDNTLPQWVEHLRSAQPTEAREIRHPMGDELALLVGLNIGEANVTVAAVFEPDRMFSAISDFNMFEGTVDEVLATDITVDPGGTEEPIPLAVARATLLDAMLGPRMNTEGSETWPILRPIANWVTRLLPEGGYPLPREV